MGCDLAESAKELVDGLVLCKFAVSRRHNSRLAENQPSPGMSRGARRVLGVVAVGSGLCGALRRRPRHRRRRHRRRRHRLRHDGFVDVSEMQAYCLGKPGAWPDNPWGHEHPVIKVHEKIFAFLGAGGVGVKGGVNRDVADEWLQRFPDDASVMATSAGPVGTTSPSAARSPTRSCSKRSTSRTVWWSRNFRRSTDRTAGTTEAGG